MQKMIIKLPKPTGSFKVGFSHLSFIDEDRIDPFPSAGGKNREIPCMIWYPSDSTENFQQRSFLTTNALGAIQEYGMYKLFSKKLCEIKTNSYENAPISTSENNFPVLLFNYGFTSFMEQSTIQMEHLASHGFIVFSIGHPYDGAVTYPDGRAVGIDQESVKAMQKSQNRKMIKELKATMAELRNPLPVDQVKRLTKKIFAAGGPMESKIDLWIEDICFISKIITKLNSGEIPSIFTEKMFLKNGIGSFGHSYGGASSIIASAVDKQISCAINQDGGMFGAFNQEYDFSKPVMFMESEDNHGMSQYFYDINKSDSIMLHIKCSKHLDYSDFTQIHRPLLLRLMGIFGKIDGERMVKLNSEYVLAFFNKHLLGIDSPLLEKSPYPEIVQKFKEE